VGDLETDTRVDGSDGAYRAMVSPAWEIWGPNGGYVAAIALRAGARESALPRPASFYCQYLNVAAFAEVAIRVVTLRRSKRSAALRVSMVQDERPILEALLWMTDEASLGLEHDATHAPEVRDPESLPSYEDLKPPEYPWFSFWQNLETRPTSGRFATEVREPFYEAWQRFRPRATFDDAVVDAARSLILVDTMQWPAAHAAHRHPAPFVAPSLDVSVQFHRSARDSEWLLCETRAPLATEGLIGGNTRVWSADRKLIASGGSQLLCRPAR
jgi:acyl-CoA thioesterase-2